MKHFATLLILAIMTLNVLLPLLEQVQSEDLYELVADVDDKDKEGTKETETEKEKEYSNLTMSFEVSNPMMVSNSFTLSLLHPASFPLHNLPPSALYISLPELPPEV